MQGKPIVIVAWELDSFAQEVMEDLTHFGVSFNSVLLKHGGRAPRGSIALYSKELNPEKPPRWSLASKCRIETSQKTVREDAEKLFRRFWKHHPSPGWYNPDLT